MVLTVRAAPWVGVYYQDGKPGNAVEFTGDEYAVRTHDGSSVKDGRWRNEAGFRIVNSCCSTFLFRLGRNDTLSDGHGGCWSRSCPEWPLQKLPRAPLRIRVVDDATEAPVTEYRYRYRLSAPEGKEYPPWIAMREVRCPDGVATIDAPMACQLSMEIDALDFLCSGSGFGSRNVDVPSTNTERMVTVRLRRGLSVEGVVLDAVSGRPIPDANVAPLIECHPSFVPDRERMVVSDAVGHFRVHAVSEWLGISVEHRRYGEREFNESEKWEKVDGDQFRRRAVLKLKEAARVSGHVIALEDGRLEGVEIESYNGRRTTTDAKGAFEVFDAAGYLRFAHPGFIDQEVKVGPTPTNLTVVLAPTYRVVGRVVDPDGRPVREFKAAMRDGPYHGETWESMREFKDRKGRFEMAVSEPVTNLIAIQAEGFALAHAPVILKRPPELLTITLQKGGAVSGKLLLPPDGRGPVKVTLVPQAEGRFWRTTERTAGWGEWSEIFGGSRGGKYAREMGTRSATADASGLYCIEHVAPGSYTLDVSGDGVVEQKRTVRIPAGGRDLPTLALVRVPVALIGAGTVRGCVYHPYAREDEDGQPHPTPWAFADGLIRGKNDAFGDPEAGLRFKADERGNFCVTNVPAGSVSVVVRFNRTFDIIGSMCTNGIVTDGQVTVIDVVPTLTPHSIVPEERVRLEVAVRVGDGSAEDFEKGAGPLPIRTNEYTRSWTLELTAKDGKCPRDVIGMKQDMLYEGRVFSIRPASSTRYSVRLRESEQWRQVRNFWESAEPLAITSATGVTYTITLPANSLCGCVTGPSSYGGVQIQLVDEAEKTVVASFTPNEKGTFVAQFLQKGTYTVIAHSESAGWWRREGIAVNGACDLGELALRRGAKVSAQLLGDWVPQGSEPYRFFRLIEDGTGVEFDRSADSTENGGCVVFSSLWPGRWTLSLSEDAGGESSRTLWSTNLSISAKGPTSLGPFNAEWTE